MATTSKPLSTCSASKSVPIVNTSALEMRLCTPKGRGIFATCRIPSGTIVDTCPILLLSAEENELVQKTKLYHYTYNWPVRIPATQKWMQRQAIILGLGSLFNHSQRQNVGWTRDLDGECVVYRTLRDIERGEELCISYGGVLWFEDADGEGREGEEEDEEDGLGGLVPGMQVGMEDGEGFGR